MAQLSNELKEVRVDPSAMVKKLKEEIQNLSAKKIALSSQVKKFE